MDTTNENQLVFVTDLRVEDFEGLNRIKTRGSVILFSVAAAVFLCLMLSFKFPQYLPYLLLGAIVVYFLFRGLGRLYVHWRSGSVFARANVSSSLTLTLNDQGITQHSNAGETELLWEDVHRVRADRNCYYVFLNSNQAFYFPKRSFASRADEDAFCELLIQSVLPAKLKF